MRYFVWLALIALTVVSMAAWSAPKPEAAAVAFVKDDGTLDPAAQAKYEATADTSLTSSSVAFEPLNTWLAVKSLSDGDRTTLLGFPELLVASSRAQGLIDTQYVLLATMTPGKHPRVEADLVDIVHRERYHLARVEGKSNEDAFNKLAESLKKRVERIRQRRGLAVAGHPDSKLYHLPNADHTNVAKLIPFKSEDEARRAGYEPCPICFPEENPLIRTDEDVQALGLNMAEIMRLQLPVTKAPDADHMMAIADKICSANHIQNPFDFYWINSDDVFSVSYTGGQTFFSSGLLRMLEGDELAALIAHELAHLQRNHFLTYFHKAYEEYGPPPIIRFESRYSYAQFLIRLQSRLLREGFPLPMEEEADDYAVAYLWRAGYRTDLYTQTLLKIQEKTATLKVKKSAWTRVHPLPPERITRLAEIPKRLADITALAKMIAVSDPGEGEAINHRAVEFSNALGNVKQFTTVLSTAGADIPVTPTSGGDPELRN